MIDETKIILFSLHGEDEHLGILVKDGSEDNIMIIESPRSIIKQMQPNQTLNVSLAGFMLSVAEPKTIEINVKHITWLTHDVKREVANMYMSSLTNLVVANQMPKGAPNLKLVK